MTITREIDGEQIKIELTRDEMFKAWDEAQFSEDRDDMDEYLNDYSDKDFEESFGKKLSDAYDCLDDLARLRRTNINKYEQSWSESRYQALEDWGVGKTNKAVDDAIVAYLEKCDMPQV